LNVIAKNGQHSSQGQHHGQGLNLQGQAEIQHLDLRGAGHTFRSQAQGHKIWPQGDSRPTPAIND